MKKTHIILLVIIAMATSCLKSGLDELPAYSDANITGVYFEYRYTVAGGSGLPELKTQSLTQTGSIDATALTVNMRVTVPNANGTFTEAERSKVSLANLCVRFNISNAASVAPIEGSPQLGVPGDFSVPRKYKVTAADGKTSKTWTIHVTAPE